jgi:signal peptide peptidase SppA
MLDRLRTLFGRPAGPLVTILRLSGTIGSMGGLRPGLSLEALAGVIERAFAPRPLSAVALAVNSPGGSAVQSALIAGRIRALAEEKKVPVIAFVEDVAASGGYWLASSADEIHADPSSVVGSIGVITAGFGFQELIRRWGVERRLHTAGEYKGMLDPFQPEQPDEVARLKALQADVHNAFMAHVRARRGDRLKADEASLFTGEFWTGRRALELGLVDGLGDLRTVLRGRFGEKVRLVPVRQHRSWLARRLRFGQSNAGGQGVAELASGLAGSLLAAAEERALWARYGL